jgi:general secretion pathway protein A
MGYYEALGLRSEPFSISPDPEFFYQSAAHLSALQRLEINVRLKRGLNLILGDVGTGKTTLGRVLVRSLAPEKDIDVHLILNPLYQSEFQFLEKLCGIFHVQGAFRSTMDCLEALEHTLYQRGVTEGKTTVLMIDEGQNLSLSLLEVLRSLLNYETSRHKLLQVVILAQLEALPRLQRVRNFIDRVSMKYVINPFDESDCRRMIEFRLNQAGWGARPAPFTDEALHAVYQAAQGYPRRINWLCQKVMEVLVSRGQSVAEAKLVDEVVEQEGVALYEPNAGS